MKKKSEIFAIDFYKIKKILNPHFLDVILSEEKSTVDTYNKIMKCYTDLEIIFVAELDTIVLHHLIMLCNQYNIQLYMHPNLFTKIYAIKRDSKLLRDINQFLTVDLEYKLVDIYK